LKRAPDGDELSAQVERALSSGLKITFVDATWAWPPAAGNYRDRFLAQNV
jgi:hypothetical protein